MVAVQAMAPEVVTVLGTVDSSWGGLPNSVDGDVVSIDTAHTAGS